jgi:hypothetical protein
MIAIIVLAFIVTSVSECTNFLLGVWRAGAANLSMRKHRAWIMLCF